MIIAALDVGGTKTIASAAFYNFYNNEAPFPACLEIIGSDSFPTAGADFDSVAGKCAALIAGILRDKGRSLADVAAAGVSMPGMVDASGKLIFAPGAGWRDIDVAPALRGAFSANGGKSDIEIKTACDVNACALAEVLASGKGDMLWVTVSTGIGGAYVSGGKVYEGLHSVAGEIGHTKVEYNSPKKCACGQYGCAEAHASGTAVDKMTKDAAASDGEWAALFERGGLALTAEGCSVLAGRGDKKATAIFEEAGDYLGRAIANAVNLLDVGAVYIGGGMSRSLNLMEGAIRRRIESDALFIHRGIPILPTVLGYNASLYGSYALAAKM